MLNLLRIACCTLLVAGCFYPPITESPLNRLQAERVVAVAYHGAAQDTAGDVRSLAYFFDVIDAQYYREVDTLKLADIAIDYLNSTEESNPEARVQGAQKAILKALDRHSLFFNREEFTAFKHHLNGEFVGIGVRIKQHDEGAIAEPLPNSPAMRAGIQKGDIIIRAGRKSFKGMNLQQIVTSLRGKIGTNVTIGVLRGYGRTEPQKLEFSLRRALIQQVLIEAKTLEDIGYIRLMAFSDETDDQIEEILEDFERQSLRGYIFDLRGNPGGLLQQAVTIADYFLDNGKIVSVQNRHKEDVFSASSYRSITERPVVILIDGATASSAEILALALSDHQRASVIGEESFGKGTVQTLYGLHDDNGLKLTTARYASPNGTILIENGIAPDIAIVDDPITSEDEVIQAALAELRR